MNTQTNQANELNNTPVNITEAQRAAYLARGRRLRSQAIRAFFAASAAYLKQGINRAGRTSQRRGDELCHGAQCD